MIRAGYELLGLITFFTAGDPEVHAWTLPRGTLAPGAAGTIHTDFEKGFIRAEVIHDGDLVRYGSEAKCREAGKSRWKAKICRSRRRRDALPLQRVTGFRARPFDRSRQRSVVHHVMSAWRLHDRQRPAN